jgi:hypothetical protein
LLSLNHHIPVSTSQSLFIPETILPNPTNNANIELLGSFDVPKMPSTNEPDELLFSISHRLQELFNDDSINDDEPPTQGKVMDGCLSSSSSSVQTRMTEKINSEPWTLPPTRTRRPKLDTVDETDPKAPCSNP